MSGLKSLNRTLIVGIALGLCSFNAMADDNQRQNVQNQGSAAGDAESVMMADPTAVEGVEPGDIHPDEVQDQQLRNDVNNYENNRENAGGGRRR